MPARLYLKLRPNTGCAQCCVPGKSLSRDVAENVHSPAITYSGPVAAQMRIIAARPGKHGGYSLAKDPAQISVYDVMHALADDQKRPAKHKKVATRQTDIARSVVSACNMVERGIDAHMSALTLQMLRLPTHSESLRQRIHRTMQQQIDRFAGRIAANRIANERAEAL